MIRDELRERIARQLCRDDNRIWDELDTMAIRLFGTSSRESYLKRADKILAIPALAKALKLLEAQDDKG